MGFIYKITNLINNKIYIGQTSRTVDIRWQEHQRNMYDDKYKNITLYKAFNKYGINNFDIKIIEEVDNSLLNEREEYWIRTYNSYKNGYNSTIGGNGQKICDIKEAVALWNEGKIVKEIAIGLGVDSHTITNYLHGYGVDSSIIYSRANKLKDNSISQPIAARKAKEINSKSVYQLNKETDEIINTFNSLSDAARAINKPNGISDISKVCKGKQKTAYGFKWKFVN